MRLNRPGFIERAGRAHGWMAGMLALAVAGIGCASGESIQGGPGPGQDGSFTSPVEGGSDDVAAPDSPGADDGGSPDVVAQDDADNGGDGGCATGLTSCDGVCVDITASAANCAGCGQACTTAVGNALASCSASTCGFVCTEGFSLCSGACVQYTTAANCGSCGKTCAASNPVCAGAAGSYSCVSGCPPAAPTACSGSCVDPTSNPNYCGGCDGGCTTSIAHAQSTCTNSTCGVACDTNYTSCSGACVDLLTDPNNCGGCGSSHACPSGDTCVEGGCQAPAPEAGTDAAPGGPDTGAPEAGGTVPCPAGGCPTSGPSGWTSCPFGSCNGSTTATCTGGGVCVCTSDSQCKSGKCVKVTGQNDMGCGSSGCSGTGTADGFDCELASPGIPVPAGSTTYSCPANAGYKNSQLTCQASHTNCYCTSDSECPSGHCVPNAANNDNCSGCTGTGTPDYRGCEATTTIPSCPIYIGCPNNTTCSYPTCYCTSDVACASGHCIPSGNNGNCSGCTGTGTSDGHGCQPPPSSIACTTSGGTACTTTLTPTPVLNSASTACLCVADSDCSSGKCVNSNSQCSPSSGCTGTGTADSEDCETATSTPNAWSCSAGNCDTVSSPSGTCTASGVPCWCTSNSQCGSGALCSSWNGCASGACTGTGDGNAFHCVY